MQDGVAACDRGRNRVACVVPASRAPRSRSSDCFWPVVRRLWWLAASGLREIVSTPAGGPGSQPVAVLLLVLLPALQAARLNAEERDDWVRPNGHENATLRQVTAGLNSVSPDAIVCGGRRERRLLLRAAVVRWTRTAQTLHGWIARRPQCRRRSDGGAVYAFPNGREDLNRRGFTTAAGRGHVRSTGGRVERESHGIAVVTGFRPCQTVGSTWVDLAVALARDAWRIVADSEAAHGPLTIFLGGSTGRCPQPEGWPPRTTRGFRIGVFDQRTGEARTSWRGSARAWFASRSPCAARRRSWSD